MAGGPHAHEVLCIPCADDDGEVVKATRIVEGVESDRYRCEKGHSFGIDWGRGPAQEPCWPPSIEADRRFLRRSAGPHQFRGITTGDDSKNAN